MKKSEIIDYCFFEGAGLAVSFASLYMKIRIDHVIFYHFVVWVFLPILQGEKKGSFSTSRYLLWMLGAAACFVLISPISGLPFALSQDAFSFQFTLWGYIHITSSFFLSSFNPAWLTRLLRFAPPSKNFSELRSGKFGEGGI